MDEEGYVIGIGENFQNGKKNIFRYYGRGFNRRVRWKESSYMG